MFWSLYTWLAFIVASVPPLARVRAAAAARRRLGPPAWVYQWVGTTTAHRTRASRSSSGRERARSRPSALGTRPHRARRETRARLSAARCAAHREGRGRRELRRRRAVDSEDVRDESTVRRARALAACVLFLAPRLREPAPRLLARVRVQLGVLSTRRPCRRYCSRRVRRRGSAAAQLSFAFLRVIRSPRSCACSRSASSRRARARSLRSPSSLPPKTCRRRSRSRSDTPSARARVSGTPARSPNGRAAAVQILDMLALVVLLAGFVMVLGPRPRGDGGHQIRGLMGDAFYQARGYSRARPRARPHARAPRPPPPRSRPPPEPRPPSLRAQMCRHLSPSRRSGAAASPQTVLGRLFIIPAACLGVAFFGWASTEIQNIMAQESSGRGCWRPAGKASFGTAALSGRRRRRHVVVMGGVAGGRCAVLEPFLRRCGPLVDGGQIPEVVLLCASSAAPSCATSSRSSGPRGARALLRRHADGRGRPPRAVRLCGARPSLCSPTRTRATACARTRRTSCAPRARAHGGGSPSAGSRAGAARGTAGGAAAGAHVVPPPACVAPCGSAS